MMLKIRKTTNNFVLLLFLLFSVLSVIQAEENTQISELYISAADSFFRENKIEQAEIFINKALVFDSDISDPYFIQAMIKLNTDKNLNNSAVLLKKSILLRKWIIYNEDRALFELGKLYTRMKDYNRAVSSFYVIEEQFIDNNEFIDYYSRALINSGFLNMAADLLKYAVSKYPLNADFQKRLINLDSTYRDQLLMQVLDENKVYNHDSDLIIEILKVMRDEGVKKELISILDDINHQNPEVVIEKIRTGKRPDNNDIDLFIKYGGFQNYRLLRNMFSLLNDESVKSYFISNLNEYSDYIRDDINSDGTYERILKVNNGLYEWFSEDMNQDGINDLFIDFQDENPSFININDKTILVYYTYPFLKALIKFEDAYSEVYTFPEKRAHFDIVDLNDILTPPRLNMDIAAALDEIIKKAENYQKNSEDNKITLLREYFKTDDVSYFEKIDSISGIITKGMKKDGKVYYSESDILLNNIFATREFYKDGSLHTIAYDGNNNNIFEFKIENNIKYWDYDEDGIYDSKEWTGEDGYRYIMFSTSLNGVFDLTVKYTNKDILEIKRDSEWISVTYEASTNIHWIGEPCSGFPLNADLNNNSIIRCGDSDVIIINAGNKIFAEVLN